MIISNYLIYLQRIKILRLLKFVIFKLKLQTISSHQHNLKETHQFLIRYSHKLAYQQLFVDTRILSISWYNYLACNRLIGKDFAGYPWKRRIFDIELKQLNTV